jgi:hypothetical protein
MARDNFHQLVRTALENDAWIITDDPLRLNVPGEKRLQTDLGGIKLIGAELDERLIAVEVKSFTRPSILYEFHAALGQYLIYEDAIERQKLKWEMHLAIPITVFDYLSRQEHIVYTLNKRMIKMILFDPTQQKIIKWII